MFTLFINLNTDTFPASRLCLLQYAAAMSCVEAVVQTPGYEVEIENIFIKKFSNYFFLRKFH
jgi:hypothetical protein